MALLHALEGAFRHRHASGRLDIALDRWRKRAPALDAFADVSALITFCRDRTRPPRSKDGALSALCVLLQDGDRDAAVLVLWLLLPGLWHAAHEARRRDPVEDDDLDADLVTGLWEESLCVRAGDARVASRLVNAARRRAYASGRAAARPPRSSLPLDSVFVSGPETLVESSDPADIVVGAMRAGVITEVEADLICATRLGGACVHAMCDRYGLSHRAVLQRRLRAEARLHAWLGGDTVPARREAPRRPRATTSPPGLPGPQATSAHDRNPDERKEVAGRAPLPCVPASLAPSRPSP